LIEGLNGLAIETITIPDSVESINGLCDCTRLADVQFGLGSRLVVINGFSKTSIGDVELPDSVEVLTRWAFRRMDKKPCIVRIGKHSKLKEVGSKARLFLDVHESFLSCRRRGIHLKAEGRPGFEGCVDERTGPFVFCPLSKKWPSRALF
jgi:hypothetical protein